jgi:hypothetical protein
MEEIAGHRTANRVGRAAVASSRVNASEKKGMMRATGLFCFVHAAGL